MNLGLSEIIIIALVVLLLFGGKKIPELMSGLGKAAWMAQYRRHAIVAILVVSAIITPTADAMTLFIVALPIWLLYELSILIVKLTHRASP